MDWKIIAGGLLVIGGIMNITTNIGAFFFCVLVGGALVYFGIRRAKGKTTPQGVRELKTETFRVTGSYYYASNIGKLACSNPDWKCTAAQIIKKGKVMERIYRYSYINKPVKLEHEPKNEHDKNAIAVIVAGEKVGYISREEARHVGDILKKGEIKYISSFIGGGQYKVVSENGDIQHLDEDINIKVRIAYV